MSPLLMKVFLEYVLVSGIRDYSRLGKNSIFWRELSSVTVTVHVGRALSFDTSTYAPCFTSNVSKEIPLYNIVMAHQAKQLKIPFTSCIHTDEVAVLLPPAVTPSSARLQQMKSWNTAGGAPMPLPTCPSTIMSGAFPNASASPFYACKSTRGGGRVSLLLLTVLLISSRPRAPPPPGPCFP